MRAVLMMLMAVFLFPFASTLANGDQSANAWEALQQGQAVLILRHALAPGTGDPPHFELGDCLTQRNLSARGREQARAWKPLLAKHGITQARVFTSQWCRSRDTATEMDLGEVTEWPPLNSFFRNRASAERQIRQTRSAVNELKNGLPVILVSHQVNITRLTGIYPSSNEGVIVELPLSENSVVLAKVSPES